MITVAVVGPPDLVTLTGEVVQGIAGVEALQLSYQHESETPQILRGLPASVDALLFTGVVPYEIAASHNLLGPAAGYVEYSGSVLLATLLRIARDGQAVTSLSIDTLSDEQTRDTLTEAGVPLERVRILPYSPGTDSARVAQFHRRVHEEDPGSIALTCVRSVYEELASEQPTMRLAPARSAVRLAVNRLQYILDSQRNGDAQVVLGLVEVDDAAEAALRAELTPLGATLVHSGPREFLLVATRGPLEEVTAGLSELPMLHRLKTQFPTVRIGFGLGGSGAEAYSLAQRALGRARALGRTGAVVSMRHDIDVTLSTTAPPRATQRGNLHQLAHRAGLSVGTMERLQELLRDRGDLDLTTREAAEHLGVQPRTARRILNRLERSGLARSVGTKNPVGSGRPLIVYRVLL